ncbi:GNAT family N-acetyltransferase [Phenylobacterium sp. LjRoot219]|uniref:GNAT family N-acetyltransferase n=1 Tax=Phenylobacterium sp. LjRoot219 TaxID=3342283 RepID=UPI003ECCA3B2
MVELRTARLTLGPVVESDAAFVLALLNDPGWIRNIGDRGVRSLDDARTYIRERFGQSLWLIVRDAAGEPLGMCGLIEREVLDSPDLGYAFLDRHSGQGYATEAAAAVLRHVREVIRLPKLAAITDPDNRASQRVLEKLGFRYVDTRELPGMGTSAYFLA